MRLCVVAYSEARWRKVESSGHFSYLQGNGPVNQGGSGTWDVQDS